MIPRIILHIGPPKTATTSIQVAIEQINHPKFHFGGTFQPRARNVDSLCQRLYSVCSSETERHSDIEYLRRELEGLLQEGKTVFLSEEMFLLEQDKASIHIKIDRLKKVLKDFECKILISARSGRFALPSLYQEIYSSLPLNLQVDFSAFCRDQRTICYDYTAVCDILSEAGFKKITIWEFDELVKERIDLSMFTGIPNIEISSTALEKANTGKFGHSEKTRTLPGVSLKSIGRLAHVKLLINRLKIRDWPGYRRVICLLDRVVLRASGERNLQVAEDVASRLDKSYRDAINCYGVHSKDSGADLS